MEQQFANGYALLIGVNENNVAKWALPDVAKDIGALQPVLTHPQRCAYPPDQVKVITGQAATRAGILDGLEWLQQRVAGDPSGNATAVVYYSGHGWRDDLVNPPTYYLVPYDLKATSMRLSSLAALDFAAAVQTLAPRRLLVILDCCHAGGMEVKGPVPTAPAYVSAAIPAALLLPDAPAVAPGNGAKGLETLAQGSGRAVLSSSQGQQSSYLRKDRAMSIFTYHLIEALTGHAQPASGASEVLVSDVMSYVWRTVPQSAQADWGEPQEPDYQVSGNFPVALLLGGQGLAKGMAAPDPLQDLGSLPAPGYVAHLYGSGAIAQGPGAVAAGERGVAVGGNVGGSIHTGDTTHVRTGPVQTGGGDFVGRDKIVHGDEVHGDKILDGRDPTEERQILVAYLRHVTRDCANLKLEAVDQSAARPDREPLQLADVYVDLDTDLLIPQETATLADYFAWSKDFDRREGASFLPKETRAVPVVEALAYQRKLVLLGKPGSGKSTLGAYVAFYLAQSCLGDAQALAWLGPAWTHGALLPVRVILRRFAAAIAPKLQRGEAARASDLWGFIQDDLRQRGLPAETGKLVERLARQGGALFVLDGLDEAATPALRGAVLDAVDEFARTAGERCRYLITARPYAWPEPPDPQVGVYSLAPLNDDQIKRFVEQWYDALVRRKWLNASDAGDKRAGLLGAIFRPDLQPLAENPLLLTLAATLHTNRGRLPDDRADLYDEVVTLLLQRWNEASGADRALLEQLEIPGLKLSDIRGVVEQLALDAHAAHVGQEDVADIDENRLRKAFLPLLQQDYNKANRVIDYIEKRAGLLIGQGERDGFQQFTFLHRTFQEFLAACALAGRADLNEQVVALARQDPAHWREVLVLAARQAKAERGALAADALVHSQKLEEYRESQKPDANDFARAILAGEQLLEIGLPAVESGEQRAAVKRRVTSWLAGALASPLAAPRRAHAGVLLAQLGDPRVEVVDPLRMEFRDVPAGDFRMGSDEDKSEQPPFTCPMPYAYRIARYPVTNAQYGAFVEAGGYGMARYWHEAQAAGTWQEGAFKGRYDRESRQAAARL